jgi:hypothetical protein
MRLFLIIVAAGAASLLIGLPLSYAASELLSCYSDPAGCGLGAAFGLIGVFATALISMLVFGLTLLATRKEDAIKLAMILLLVPIAVLLLLGPLHELRATGSINFDLARDVQGLLQFFLPMCLVVIVQ